MTSCPAEVRTAVISPGTAPCRRREWDSSGVPASAERCEGEESLAAPRLVAARRTVCGGQMRYFGTSGRRRVETASTRSQAGRDLAPFQQVDGVESKVSALDASFTSLREETMSGFNGAAEALDTLADHIDERFDALGRRLALHEEQLADHEQRLTKLEERTV